MDLRKTWLASLQTGDSILITCPNRPPKKDTITHSTKQYFLVGKLRFLRTNGQMVMNSGGAKIGLVFLEPMEESK